MTDGIIQEVFKSYIEYYQNQTDKMFYGKHIKWNFEDLQKELIERIRVTLIEMCKDGKIDVFYRNAVLRKLIGDSNE